jgi:hypothetical protein
VIKITNFLGIIHHPKFKITDILENGISPFWGETYSVGPSH